MFLSKDVMVNVLKLIAIRNNFQFKVLRSSNSRYSLVCIVEGCQWMIYVSACNKTNTWVVRKYNSCHSCQLDVVTAKHRQASALLVSECVRSELLSTRADRMTPKDIIDYTRTHLKVNISYFTARKARELAFKEIRGSFEDSYAMLPIIAEQLQRKNPGTCYDIEVDLDGKFRYFFIAFGASINGWRFCRPVISVDGTFLKGKYRGTLLIAACLDGDNHIFPLGFSIVDSENDLSWLWFFQKLKSAIGTRDDLVIISDRKSSIPKAVVQVFPDAKHAICIEHLLGNLKTKFHCCYIQPLFYRCAKAYTKKEYEHFLERMESINPGIKTYLMDANPELWARSQFPSRRYNVMTTNISECLNAILKEARGWPVSYLVVAFRNLLQKWFYERSCSSSTMLSSLTNWSFGILFANQEDARSMSVNPINLQEFQVINGLVNEVVDIVKRTCSCCAWQLDDFPCAHAIAALWKINLSPQIYISPYYSKDFFASTYLASLYPISDTFRLTASTESESIIGVPIDKPLPGRPKKKRFRSWSELNHVRCSSCGQSGHNKRSCKVRL